MADSIFVNKYFVIALLIILLIFVYLYVKKSSCQVEGMQNVDLTSMTHDMVERPWADDYQYGNYKIVGNKFDKKADKYNRNKNNGPYVKRKDQVYTDYVNKANNDSDEGSNNDSNSDTSSDSDTESTSDTNNKKYNSKKTYKSDYIKKNKSDKKMSKKKYKYAKNKYNKKMKKNEIRDKKYKKIPVPTDENNGILYSQPYQQI